MMSDCPKFYNWSIKNVSEMLDKGKISKCFELEDLTVLSNGSEISDPVKMQDILSTDLSLLPYYLIIVGILCVYWGIKWLKKAENE